MKGATRTLLVAALAAAAIGGCQQYTTYPAVPTASGPAESPNNPATEAAMVAALQYVATRYPPGGPTFEAKTPAEAGRITADYPFAINVPKGMRKSFYERIATKVGPEVVPVTETVLTEGTLPIYHVTRVWLRWEQGTIDVLRPMPELGTGSDGNPIYQKVTVKLEGGFKPWRVIHARAWEPGIDPQPEIYPLPEIERVDQYRYSMENQVTWTPGTTTAGANAAATPTTGEETPGSSSVEKAIRVRPITSVTPETEGSGSPR